MLRKAATDAVRTWTFRPVIRNGAPVTAYTNATVDFIDRSKGRSSQQILLDLEQDVGGGDKSRRYDLLDQLALAAVNARANEKADGYGDELLAAAAQDPKGWN